MAKAGPSDDGLVFTGKFAGGLRADLARRMPHYFADFKDGFHTQVAGSTLFLYFACLANAIAFGALTGFMTDGQIGTTEMMIATAAGGGLDRVVKLTVYLTDLGDFAAVNEVMAEYFEEPFPARAAVGVASLPRDAGVEVEAIMVLD